MNPSPLDFLSFLDDALLSYLNSFMGRSDAADHLIWTLASDTLFKGVLVMTAYWWAWFRASESRIEPESPQPREILLYILLICVPAVFIARLSALFLPFRLRPLRNPQLHVTVSQALPKEAFEGWSSFPSDHAILFTILSVGLYLVSRRLGWMMYLYVALIILLPRICLGIHYPSDILAGILFGIASASTVQITPLRRAIIRPAQWLQEHSPGWFYAIWFQLTYQTAVLYDPWRHLARSALEFAGSFIKHT